MDKEVVIHLFICLFTLLFVAVTQSLGTTNPAPSGAHCGTLKSPQGCAAKPEVFGECENPELTNTDGYFCHICDLPIAHHNIYGMYHLLCMQKK